MPSRIGKARRSAPQISVGIVTSRAAAYKSPKDLKGLRIGVPLGEHLVAVEVDQDVLARGDLGRQRIFAGAVNAGNGNQLGLQAQRKNSRIHVAAGAGHGFATQGGIHMDVAIGNHFGSGIDDGQHHQIRPTLQDRLGDGTLDGRHGIVDRHDRQQR